MEPCNTRLDCGHVCQSVCHPGDPDHKEYQCRQKCTKMLCKDHRFVKLITYNKPILVAFARLVCDNKHFKIITQVI